MKHKASVTIGALALATSSVAYAVPDECDVGGGALEVGEIDIVDAAHHTSSFMPEVRQDSLGRSIVMADFDGDGVNDLAIGADGSDLNGGDSGAVYVWLSSNDVIKYGGGPRYAADADIILYGEFPGDRSGWALGAADVDGDGMADLLVGSLPARGASGGAGIVHVVSGAEMTDGRLTVDLETESMARIFGENPGDQFGSALTGLGDLNGDGYDDILIGAPSYSEISPVRGAAYLFYGPLVGNVFAGDEEPGGGEDVRFDGGADKSDFGAVVALLGDVNGDGVPDIGIGAPRDATAAPSAGVAHVFFTHAFDEVVAATSADIRIFGRMGTRCGSSIATAGDVDLDGFAEFWVGCTRGGGGNEGGVYLQAGTDLGGIYDIAALERYSVWGGALNALAGSSIATADFDGDGFLDLLVGGERAPGNVLGSGAAWIDFGPWPVGERRKLHDAGAILLGKSYDSFFGAAVAAGDVNGDGFDDLVVGAWKSSDSGPYRGGLAVLRHGGADTRDLTEFYADADADGYGDANNSVWACEQPAGYVANAGDCNDSDDQWYPGAPESCDDPNDYNCDGAVQFADNDGDGVPACDDCNDNDPEISPNQPEVCGDGIDNDCNGLIDSDDLGAIDGVVWYPDFDGDGYGSSPGVFACEVPDNINRWLADAGADCDGGDPRVNPGADELCGDGIDNDCNGEIDDGLAINASTFWADADADGFGDPLSPIKACTAPPGYSDNRLDCDDGHAGTKPGQIESCNYIDDDCDGMHYLGGEVDATRAHAVFAGSDPNDQLRAVAYLQDQDFDGDDELVLASPSGPHRDDGSFVLEGGYVVVKRGELAGGEFKESFVDAAGNVWDTRSGSSLERSQWWDVRFEASRPRSNFGAAVATGDFNGDGVHDIAIGAPGASAPNVNQGAVYVFFGPLADGVYQAEEANVILRGERTNVRFGSKIEFADLDGDSFDDLIISSPRMWDQVSGARNQGKVYVVYGSPSLVGNHRVDLQAEAWFLGRAIDEEAGTTLAKPIDFDGDGSLDLIVGAPNYAGIGAYYIVYGNGSRRSGPMLENARVAGVQFGFEFARALSAVGDVNADGFDDLMIGTRGNAWLVLGREDRLSSNVDGRIAVNTIHAIDFRHPTVSTGLGKHLAAVGDVNNDGIDDIYMGAPDYNGVSNDSGVGYLIYGRPNTDDGRTGFDEFLGPEKQFWVSSVESYGVPDYDRPPMADGTPIVYSAQSFNTLEGAEIHGPPWDTSVGGVNGGRFGYAVGGGDYDGDGVVDMVISGLELPKDQTDPQLGSLVTKAGRAHVFLGGAYGVDVLVDDDSRELWYWDWDADTFTRITDPDPFLACEMHRPISFRDPANPVPRGWGVPSEEEDCNDRDPTIYPGAPEAPGEDGIDHDCDSWDAPNVLPEVSVTISWPDMSRPAPRVTDVLTAHGIALDVDPYQDESLLLTTEYRWLVSVDGETFVEIPGQVGRTLNPVFFQAGNVVRVEFRADDGRGVTEWVYAEVQVGNSPPRLEACTVNPPLVGVSTDMTATAQGLADDDAADQGHLSVRYQWQLLQDVDDDAWIDIPGATLASLDSCRDRDPDPEIKGPYDCFKGSQLRVRCTPRDRTQDGTTIVSAPVVIRNTPPEMESCAIVPLAPRTTDILDASIESVARDVDVYDNALTIRYEWLIDGVETGHTGPTLPPSYTSHFNSVQVRCTPQDPSGAVGGTMTSAPVLIQNTPPTPVTINLLPDSPRSNQDLYVDIVQPSTDLDGDPIEYLYFWSRDGAYFYDPTPSSITEVLERDTVRGQQWSVTVVPTDGYDNGVGHTDSVTIRNTPPVMTAAGIEPVVNVPVPTRPQSRDNLTAIPVGFYDHDGDPDQSEFQWFVNGTQVPPASGGTSRTLPFGYAKRGDLVHVTIRPYDGLEYGTASSSSFVEILNSPPEAPVLNNLAPTIASEEDPLTCSFAAVSFDQDNDQVSYTVQWWRIRPHRDGNGAPILDGTGQLQLVKETVGIHALTGNAYELSPAETEFADRFYCVVIPHDGFTAGPAAQTAELSIRDLNAPAAPIVEAIERYRNVDTVTLSGECDSFPNNCYDLHYSCKDENTGTIIAANSIDWCNVVDEETGDGEFSIPIALSAGADYSCDMWCFDFSGNRSLNSNRVYTEVCDPHDSYELLGIGNTQINPINENNEYWSALDDSGNAEIEIVGNIIGTGIEFSDLYDWYRIRTTDNRTADQAAGVDRYNFQIEMEEGASVYDIRVLREDVGGNIVQQCPLTGVYDHYNFYNITRTGDGEHAHRGPIEDLQSCNSTTAQYNQCEDYTSNYYIRVSRSGAESCQPYRLRVSNGKLNTWP